MLRSLVPNPPLVIVADGADPCEVATALDLGAEGFITADVRRQLAIEALSSEIVLQTQDPAPHYDPISNGLAPRSSIISTQDVVPTVVTNKGK
jgi:DNA-binding NarL/FixJ family response regulator